MSPVGAAADVQIDSVAFPAMVSRKHCRLRRDADGAFFVDDLGAANGTTLNGRRVRQRTGSHGGAAAGGARLADGDTLLLGACEGETRSEACYCVLLAE